MWQRGFYAMEGVRQRLFPVCTKGRGAYTTGVATHEIQQAQPDLLVRFLTRTANQHGTLQLDHACHDTRSSTQRINVQCGLVRQQTHGRGHGHERQIILHGNRDHHEVCEHWNSTFSMKQERSLAAAASVATVSSLLAPEFPRNAARCG